jgi:micrococcal nuclease|tara:strand:- start:816 stop:1241 length:426 start_codon:yes stop_codon:yes gene_type:complete
MYEYKVEILKVVDGDTVDVNIDLGFNIWMRKERVRIMSIDTPESRTSDKIEKVFGIAAKERLQQLLGKTAILVTEVINGVDARGKFGRTLGDFYTEDGRKCGDILIEEGHAVRYHGQSKDYVQELHLINRQRLILEGKVVL